MVGPRETEDASMRHAARPALLAFAVVSCPATAAQLAAGPSHNLAISSRAEVWAWGINSYGLLGNGTTINSTIPVRSGTLTNVSSVAAGDALSAALTGDGTVWTWGIGGT